MNRSLFLALSLCAFPSFALADDFANDRLDNWHQWRGPNATGVAPHGDPPVKWDDKTNIKWKTAIPGRGTSTPIVWGDQVFVLTAIETGKVAADADLPKVDPKLEKRTSPPKTYDQFVVNQIAGDVARFLPPGHSSRVKSIGQFSIPIRTCRISACPISRRSTSDAS